jgi:hypothetical protein
MTGAEFITSTKVKPKKPNTQSNTSDKLALPQTLALLKHTLAKKTPISLCSSIKTRLLKVERRQN